MTRRGTQGPIPAHDKNSRCELRTMSKRPKSVKNSSGNPVEPLVAAFSSSALWKICRSKTFRKGPTNIRLGCHRYSREIRRIVYVLRNDSCSSEELTVVRNILVCVFLSMTLLCEKIQLKVLPADTTEESSAPDNPTKRHCQ